MWYFMTLWHNDCTFLQDSFESYLCVYSHFNFLLISWRIWMGLDDYGYTVCVHHSFLNDDCCSRCCLWNLCVMCSSFTACSKHIDSVTMNAVGEAELWLSLMFSAARSGYRIQVDPEGNATRAIYYMERELANLDPSRPANYNRCEWQITSCYSCCQLYYRLLWETWDNFWQKLRFMHLTLKNCTFIRMCMCVCVCVCIYIYIQYNKIHTDVFTLVFYFLIIVFVNVLFKSIKCIIHFIWPFKTIPQINSFDWLTPFLLHLFNSLSL